MMLKPYDKHLARRNKALVRGLFMREWDPIGVNDVPDALDEDDGYVAKAYVMLMHEQASAEQIADYLYRIETGHMGLGQSSQVLERARYVARLLFEMRPQFEVKDDCRFGANYPPSTPR